MLISGRLCIVDDEDIEKISQYRWSFDSSTGYAQSHIRGKKIYLHRLIMNNPKGLVVDHIDGNRFNNSKSNLRVCTRKKNSYNTHTSYLGQTSRYKGVTYQKGKWYAYIIVNNVKKHLGVFEDENLAAMAYNDAAIVYFGRYASLNKIEF